MPGRLRIVSYPEALLFPRHAVEKGEALAGTAKGVACSSPQLMKSIFFVRMRSKALGLGD